MMEAPLLLALMITPVKSEPDLEPPLIYVRAGPGLRDALASSRNKGLRTGWQKTPASLLLLDDHGELYNEIGLGDWREELGSGQYTRRRMLGGTSKDGRFAWHWQRLDTLRSGRVDQVVSSTRTLVYLGTAGQILWTNTLADAPEGIPPVLQSADGETALVLERTENGWIAAAFTFTGNRIMDVKASDRLEKAALTENGRFVTVRWSALDLPLFYSFLDLKNKTRKDIPAADVPLGEAQIDEHGVVRSGKKVVYRFP